MPTPTAAAALTALDRRPPPPFYPPLSLRRFMTPSATAAKNTAAAVTAKQPLPLYCASRYLAVRRLTREVRIGNVGVGGKNPLRLQSMTTSDTLDVAATVRQCVNLAESGCEIIRITAPNPASARALRDIRAGFSAAGAGFADIPLVADIHFIPAAAMEAVEHVEKVRVNPGNYADKKRFGAHDYTDAEYASELVRLHEVFSPLVQRAKVLGRSLRIGSNHGSLSDRVMNRYGDSPLGMVECALEFVRVCEANDFRDIVLSFKSSNPKIMIAAYRLAAAKMAAEGMDYPLHLGVTEAGEGQDGRIKSAIGIGALLYDGLGDTLRVSLTEDPWFEVPVAKELAQRAEKLWAIENKFPPPDDNDSIAYEQDTGVDPLHYRRRETAAVVLAPDCKAGHTDSPRVIVPATKPLTVETISDIVCELRATHATQPEIRAEGLLVSVETAADFAALPRLGDELRNDVKAIFAEVGDFDPESSLEKDFHWALPNRLVVVRQWSYLEATHIQVWARFCKHHNFVLAIDTPGVNAEMLGPGKNLIGDLLMPSENLIFTLGFPDKGAPKSNPLAHYRDLAQILLAKFDPPPPLWIRNTAPNGLLVFGEENYPKSKRRKAWMVEDLTPYVADFPARLLDASILSGALFCDGLGDLISVEDVPSQPKSLTLAYDILQGARMRVSKTEYVACPSCGRTLFDIQTATQKIKSRTGHLTGVTIAVMGCIVNGPGEMADADFGYVGGAPGKINLYVRRECVKFGVPQDEAVDRLIDLIKSHGKWVEPK
jgi:(E)-4-hydroxy-3-methylbut-2-enyl-diphosphate synthase